MVAHDIKNPLEKTIVEKLLWNSQKLHAIVFQTISNIFLTKSQIRLDYKKLSRYKVVSSWNFLKL